MPPELLPWLVFAASVVGALLIAVVVVAVLSLPVRLIARRRGWSDASVRRVRRPFRALLAIVAVWVAVSVSYPVAAGEDALQQILRILTIAGAGWLLIGLVSAALGGVLERYPVDVIDNRQARRVHTQVLMIRRVTTAIVVIITVAAILLTFPGVQALGASLLASAGIASVVAGLAAQSTLSNVFAGIQLAFSDAVRVDDRVVVDGGQLGRIEEITLTYVVVRLWDDRRLVLPSTWFTQTPFENWTRSTSDLIGAVEMDLDWRVDTEALRDELQRILESAEQWDGRKGVIQVTDAIGGHVRVRALVSAADAPGLWDLRCAVREGLVRFAQTATPTALPVQRIQVVDDWAGRMPDPPRVEAATLRRG